MALRKPRNTTSIEETPEGFVASCKCGWSEFRTLEERAERSIIAHREDGCDAAAAVSQDDAEAEAAADGDQLEDEA